MTQALLSISKRLADIVDGMRFRRPVTHVYHPLRYAWPLHVEYLRRFGTGSGRVLFVGMNPGPWGMAQTGVPFGEVGIVREWMGLSGRVGKPATEHPKRPVTGLACGRSEVSGRRFWGWANAQFGPAAAFFETCFVINYCPLMFLQASGANLTPDRLAVSERRRLFGACDDALRAVCETLRPRLLVGIGGFAAKRIQEATEGRFGPIAQVLHPSPASPAANGGWSDAMTQAMLRLGFTMPLQSRVRSGSGLKAQTGMTIAT